MPSYDRFTISWTGDRGIALAARFRKLAGERGMNIILKRLVEEWVKAQESQGKGT